MKTLDEKEILIPKMTENLPVLRKKLKLTQEELADIIGSGRHTVMLIESGKRRMTWNTFCLWFYFLRKTNQRLFF